MDNAEVIEQLVEINEQVAKLQRAPDEGTLEILIKCIIKSQKLILEYQPRESAKAQLSKSYLKMVKAEELARDYKSLHEESLSLFDLEVVFDTYQEAFEAFFDLN